MYFSKALLLAFAATAFALPHGQRVARATSCDADDDTTTDAATTGGVLTATTYANFQISDGVAGNALDEVNAKFPVSC